MRWFVLTFHWYLACLFSPQSAALAVLRHHHTFSLSSRIRQRRQKFFSTSSSTTTANSIIHDHDHDQENGGTVTQLTFHDDDNNNPRLVTLIGTAHLSKSSMDEVTSVITTSKPDVVMVELDVSRLQRIGIASTDQLGLPFCTVEDISVPLQDDDRIAAAANNGPWWILSAVQDLFLNVITGIARFLLTNMYNDMGRTMGDDIMGGGEFLAAIRAAQNDPSCQKLVLGDRDSLVTIRRTAELAIRNGDLLGLLSRMQAANHAEIELLQKRVIDEKRTNVSDNNNDEGDITTAVLEAIKQDADLRNRIFERLEKEAPEFHRAFLTERDYIMAKAIEREISSGARHLVAVVGLAHVPGITANLESSSLRNCCC